MFSYYIDQHKYWLSQLLVGNPNDIILIYYLQFVSFAIYYIIDYIRVSQQQLTIKYYGTFPTTPWVFNDSLNTNKKNRTPPLATLPPLHIYI